MPGPALRDSLRVPAETLGAIAVAFDGTGAAWHATGYAARAARRAGADLEILRVTEVPACRKPVGAGAPGVDASKDVRRRMLDELERAVAAVDPVVDAQVVLLYGDPVHELVRASFRFDLLVVGSRGYGPARGAPLGPVAARVKRLAACRVVVAPPPSRSGRLRAGEYEARARPVPDARRGGAA